MAWALARVAKRILNSAGKLPAPPKSYEMVSKNYPKIVIASEAWQSRSWNRLEKQPKSARISFTVSVLG